MIGSRLRRAAAMLLLVPASTAGCGSYGAGDDVHDVPAPTVPAAYLRSAPCPHEASLLLEDDDVRSRAGALPAGVVPTTFTRCTAVQGGDEDVDPDAVVFRVDQAGGGVTAALLGALSEPDQEVEGNFACAAIALPLVRVFLTDERGRSVRARLPRDQCGPRADVIAIVNAVPASPQATFDIQKR